MDGILGDLAPLMRYRDRVGSAGFVEPMGKIRAARPGIGRELGPDLPDPTRDRLGRAALTPLKILAPPYAAWVSLRWKVTGMPPSRGAGSGSSEARVWRSSSAR